MRAPQKVSRWMLVGLGVLALGFVAPSTSRATGEGSITECEKSCYGSFIRCSFHAIISCWQQYGGDSEARRACIQDEIANVCKPEVNMCLADCREPGTEEEP